MECNKDEAIRAKEFAEKKFMEKDIAGAKKFAAKAQSLYPGLEGISQMMTILDVYASAEKKAGREMDWYSVLGVSPWADDEAIKKHYKKLALLLHPDKNKSVGADGAFQLVLEAFSILSDKIRRSVYNQKINVRPSQKRFPTQTGVSAVPPSNTQGQQKSQIPTQGGVPAPQPSFNPFPRKVPTSGGASVVPPGKRTYKRKVQSENQGSTVPASNNGHHGQSSNPASFGRTHSSKSQWASAPAPSSRQERNSFWTICSRCRMQYEYLRKYLNQLLLCPNCKLGFKAVETPPPSNLSMSSEWFPWQRHPKPSQRADNSSFNKSNAQETQFFGGMASGTMPSSSSTAGEACNIGQTRNEKVNGEREETFEGANSCFKKGRMVNDKLSKNCDRNIPNTSGAVNEGTDCGSAPKVFSGGNSQSYINTELSQTKLKDVLTDKTMREVSKKLEEWKSEFNATVNEKEKAKEREMQQQKHAKYVDHQSRSGHGESPCKKPSPGTSVLDTQNAVVELASMKVPDSDFHDFDFDRTELSFGDNEVWAAYDTDDGMPRFYALIHKVISVKPFKMQISWLNSKSNTELGPIDWVSRGFTKTCGEFRIGKHLTNQSLSSFSHKVMWTKGRCGVVQIYPAKGDIWALYRNWSPDWNQETPEEVIHDYELVVVVEDYNEDQGVIVAPLVKASGFQTVFCQQLDAKELKRIPKGEIFRFSHQVPGYLLTTEQALNAPGGSFDLDPAAIPEELLRVMETANEEQEVGNVVAAERVSECLANLLPKSS
ncbi:hypothetical protein Ancab_009897 [Ancistrocladus abbreviatus]